jgi:hypothetical protein
MMLTTGRVTCLAKVGDRLMAGKDTGAITGWTRNAVQNQVVLQKYQEVLEFMEGMEGGQQVRLPSLGYSEAEMHHSGAIKRLGGWGEYLISVDREGTVCRWQLGDRKLIHSQSKSLRTFNEYLLVNQAELSGSYLAACTTQGVKLLKLESL